MIYKPFFRDDLGYKPRYTQPLHLEEVVVSPIYSENEDYKIDFNSLGYKPVYNINPEGIVLDDSKSDSTLSYTFSSKEDFKSIMLPIYEKVLSEKGINTIFAKSLVAQDGLESAWGSAPSGDNNFGGIKSRYDKKLQKYIDPGTLLKTREVVDGEDEYPYQMFRNFVSLEDYARYKVNLLNGSRYRAFDGGLEDFSRRVSAGGYATDPRYKEVLDRVIRSVRRGGILRLQQAGKFVPDIGDATRIVNWEGIGITGERGYNSDYIDYIYNRLIDYGYDSDTTAIIIGNIMDESGGDPYARDGEFKGLLQWSDERYKIKDVSDPYNEIDNQLEYLHSTIDNITDQVSWTHGGDGSGYKRGYNARDQFKYDSDLYRRHHAFSFGYVRPYKEYSDKIAAANNRFKNVAQVLERIR